jgi:hypothetical protein
MEVYVQIIAKNKYKSVSERRISNASMLIRHCLVCFNQHVNVWEVSCCLGRNLLVFQATAAAIARHGTQCCGPYFNSAPPSTFVVHKLKRALVRFFLYSSLFLKWNK